MDESGAIPKWTDYLLLLAAIVAGAWMRIDICMRGHNFDVDSWRIVADLVWHHKNIYIDTWRYPYAPTFAYISAGLLWIHDALHMSRLGPESFHLIVVIFETLVEIVATLLLFRAYGLIAALFFFVNPVLVLLTGYHSQIDTLALVPGLGAWLLIRPKSNASPGIAWSRLIIAALLVGLSLSIKHILIYLPIWVLLCPQITGGMGKRVVFALIAWAIFAVSLAPYSMTPQGRHAVRVQVIDNHPTGFDNDTLVSRAIDLFIPSTSVSTGFGFSPDYPWFRTVMSLLMIGCGWIVARRAPGEMFACYLAAMLVCSHLLANQYLAIPVMACAIQWRRWPAWIYTIVAAAIMQVGLHNAGIFPPPKPWWQNLFGTGLQHGHAVIWLLILLLQITSLWSTFWRRLLRKD